MAKEAFKNVNFQKSTLSLISKCNEILDDYAGKGYDMTLRQLYYQLVSQVVIKNNQKEYNRLGNIVNEGRLAGLIDWDTIVDRTRSLKGTYHYESPEDIIRDNISSFALDKWEGQEFRVEIWVEKEALAGVFSRVASEMDIDFFSCRGYPSQSEMYRAAKRFARYNREGQTPVILHFGDHDPSGLDMSRDLRDRLELLSEGEVIEVKRLALNMDQVRKYNPPPNPAKISDSRAGGYIRLYGRSSWELDALPPDVLADLVREDIGNFIDWDKFNKLKAQEKEERDYLRMISRRFDEVKEFLAKDTEEEE